MRQPRDGRLHAAFILLVDRHNQDASDQVSAGLRNLGTRHWRFATFWTPEAPTPQAAWDEQPAVYVDRSTLATLTAGRIVALLQEADQAWAMVQDQQGRWWLLSDTGCMKPFDVFVTQGGQDTWSWGFRLADLYFRFQAYEGDRHAV